MGNFVEGGIFIDDPFSSWCILNDKNYPFVNCGFKSTGERPNPLSIAKIFTRRIRLFDFVLGVISWQDNPYQKKAYIMNFTNQYFFAKMTA